MAFDFLDARGTAEAAVEDVATGLPRLTGAAAAARVVVGWWLLEPQLAVDVQADRVRLEYPQISVPEHARVRFTLSVNPALWRAPFSQGVRFRLLGRDGARKVVLLDRSIDPWQRPEDRAPQPVDHFHLHRLARRQLGHTAGPSDSISDQKHAIRALENPDRGHSSGRICGTCSSPRPPSSGAR